GAGRCSSPCSWPSSGSLLVVEALWQTFSITRSPRTRRPRNWLGGLERSAHPGNVASPTARAERNCEAECARSQSASGDPGGETRPRCCFELRQLSEPHERLRLTLGR